MRSKLPVIVVVAGAVAVLWLAVALRRSVQAPEPAREKPGAADTQHVRSARVEERLQHLREAYEREREAENQAQAAAAVAERSPAAVGTPAPAPGDTAGQWEGAKWEHRTAWKPPTPVRRAGAPGPAKSGFKRDPRMRLPHPGGAFGQHWDAAKIENTILNGKDAKQRDAALALLAGEEEVEAIRILMEALAKNDPDPKFRAALVQALGDYPELIAPAQLDPALHDPAADVRFEALSVLAEMNGNAGRQAAQAAVGDPDPDVRDLAQGILEMQ